jgi:hypothetical protein
VKGKDCKKDVESGPQSVIPLPFLQDTPLNEHNFTINKHN